MPYMKQKNKKQQKNKKNNLQRSAACVEIVPDRLLAENAASIVYWYMVQQL